MTALRDLYPMPGIDPHWHVPNEFDAVFDWRFDEGRTTLMHLYQKGKDKQWDAQSRIDWAQDVDPMNPIGLPDEFHPLFGSPMWEAADDNRRAEFRRHSQSWQFSQFLHGEQGALVCTAKIVETVPWIDAKYYAATQVVDEARHVEVFAAYIQKLGEVQEITPGLQALLDRVGSLVHTTFSLAGIRPARGRGKAA